MSTETHKSLVRRFYDEALNARRLDVIDELALADYIEHEPLPGQRDGLVGFKDRASMLIEGLASTYTLHDVIAEGDRVVVRWTNTGIHSGEFLGIPPPVDPSTSPASISTGSRMTHGRALARRRPVDPAPAARLGPRA